MRTIHPFLFWLILLMFSWSGCSTDPKVFIASQDRPIPLPESMFAETFEQYHLPSAKANGKKREKLLELAAQGYLNLLQQYPDDQHWCAQALRSVGSVSAEQGELDDAIRYYSQVAEKYPDQSWDVLQSWKAAADLLWEYNRKKEADVFYQNIVDRFDGGNEPQVIQIIVRAAKIRLQGEGI